MAFRELDLDRLDFTKGDGYVTVVTQDARTREVLMVARADREALERTLETGEMHYHSRSRGPWHKGATSGHVQRVVSLAPDCDGDVVLALVEPAGPACHTGAVSCFAPTPDAAPGGGEGKSAEGRGAPPPTSEATAPLLSHPHRPVPDIIAPAPDVLDRLAATIRGRAEVPDAPDEKPSYTRCLLGDRNLRLKKLGEEAIELAVACADGDRPRAAEEGADVVYHALVALAAVGVTLDDVRAVLQGRERG